jgi:SOS-response transcriptional repressor LexA
MKSSHLSRRSFLARARKSEVVIQSGALRDKGIGHSLRLVKSEIDLSDVTRRNTEQTSHPAVQPVMLAVLGDRRALYLLRDTLELQNLSLAGYRTYSDWRKEVKEKNPTGAKGDLRVRVGERLRGIRERLGWTQAQMAQHLHVTTGAYGKWETDRNYPRGPVFAAIARVAPEDERPWLLGLAGLPESKESTPSGADERRINILSDAMAAGTPRAVDDSLIEGTICFPSAWLRGGNLVAVHVSGDSMFPIIRDGYIVVLDTARRDAKKLTDQMVAVREGDGVTIKWLRRDGDIYLLVPQNVSLRHPVRVMRPEGDFSIVGLVVKLIGDVPLLKRA